MGGVQAKQNQYAVPIKSDQQSKNQSPIYRNPKMPDKLLVNLEENPLHSLYQVFKLSRDKYPKNLCFGKKISQENSKSYYEWLTYEQVDQLVIKTAKLIKMRGFLSDEYNFVSIVAPNCNEWMITDLAINMIGGASVPFYQALSSEAIQHIINETEVHTLFGSGRDLLNFINLPQDSTKGIKNLISFNEVTEEMQNKSEGRFIFYDFWKQMKSQEVDSYQLELQPISPDSLFTLSYTSGTTGVPKGVMISNQNMISALVAGAQTDYIQNVVDRIISYLPLAHVFGRIGVYSLLYNAGSIGNYSGVLYFQLIFITNQDYTTLMDDIQTLQPTLMPAVPRILNRIYDGINAKVKESNWVKRSIFKAAVSSKVQRVRKDGEVKSGFYDAMIFSKLKKMFGGKVRTIGTGAAPITQEVLEFFRIAFCCNVIQGYGLTQSTCGAFQTNNFQNSVGHVGGPRLTCEFRLQDVPEMDYYHTDKPNPRGQILLRGSTIVKGYFKQPQKTAEAFDEDGWFHTGDIGQIVQGNALKIIDRKKNIFKLSQGEYIAPYKVEGAYANCPSISQMFIYGDSFKDYIVAIIVADENEIKKFSNLLNIDDPEEVCKSAQFKKQVEEEMNEAAKVWKLNSLEQVKGNFALVSTPFSDKDILTPTMKVKRNAAKEKFQDLIDQLYQKK